MQPGVQLSIGGGGEGPGCRMLERRFIESLPKNARLLYIPIADESGDFFENHRFLKSKLTHRHDVTTNMWVSVYGKSYSELKKYNAIYISGGNTFLLAKVLYLSGFKSLLKKFIFSGRPVFGDSAGAIIFGSSTKTAEFGHYPDDNIVEWHYKGLRIFGPLAIHCHYQSREDREISDFCKKNHQPVLALPENSGLEWSRKGKIRVYGALGARFFNQETKIKMLPGFLYDYSALYFSRLGKGITLSGSWPFPSPEAKAAG